MPITEEKHLVWFVPAILVLALTAGCSPRGPREFAPRDGVEKKTKLVLIAVDGLEPTLLDSLLSGGRLPVMQRLIDNGTLSSIQCVTPLVSPVVWTTVATGVMPEVHGITGFTVDGVPAGSNLRRVPAFWNILEKCGLLSSTLGWQVSWPAEKNSGIIISSHAYWGDFSEKTVPSDALDLERYRRKDYTDYDDLASFTSASFDPDYESLPGDDPHYAINFLIEHRLMDPYVRDTIYTDMAMDVVEKYNPEVLALYLYGIDYTGHGFWQWFERDPFREAGWTVGDEETQRFHEVIPRYYEYTDYLVGRLLDYVGGEPLVLLLSDHGFGPKPNLSDSSTGKKGNGEAATMGDFISGNHRDRAVLIASGPAVKNGAVPRTEVTHLDILPTMLCALGLEPPDSLPGRILDEYFADAFKPAVVPLPAGIVESIHGERVPRRSEHDVEILENLKSLGYIK